MYQLAVRTRTEALSIPGIGNTSIHGGQGQMECVLSTRPHDNCKSHQDVALVGIRKLPQIPWGLSPLPLPARGRQGPAPCISCSYQYTMLCIAEKQGAGPLSIRTMTGVGGNFLEALSNPGSCTSSHMDTRQSIMESQQQFKRIFPEGSRGCMSRVMEVICAPGKGYPVSLSPG